MGETGLLDTCTQTKKDERFLRNLKENRRLKSIDYVCVVLEQRSRRPEFQRL